MLWSSKPPMVLQETSSVNYYDLEVRICGDQFLVDEDTPVDLVQLYIQWTMMILCVIRM